MCRCRAVPCFWCLVFFFLATPLSYRREGEGEGMIIIIELWMDGWMDFLIGGVITGGFCAGCVLRGGGWGVGEFRLEGFGIGEVEVRWYGTALF